MKLQIENGDQDIRLGLGYGVDLLLMRSQESGPVRWYVRGLLMDSDGVPVTGMPELPSSAFLNGLERAYQLQTGAISGREAQVARALLEEEMGDLPTADDTQGVEDLRIEIAECANCSQVGRSSGMGFFRKCAICGKDTTIRQVEVEDASTFALLNFSEGSLRKITHALKRDRQHTLDAKRIGGHNAAAVLIYCALAGGFELAAGRLERRPDLCRYFVDAAEGAGAI